MGLAFFFLGQNIIGISLGLKVEDGCKELIQSFLASLFLDSIAPNLLSTSPGK